LIRDRQKVIEWLRNSFQRVKDLAGRLKITGKDEQQSYRRADVTLLSKLDKSRSLSPHYSTSRPVKLDPNLVADNRCIAILSDAPEIEPYRVLRTQMFHRLRDMGGKTVMITSAVPDEGKTITALNLALTLAKDFHETVLLVDADLRKQAVHTYLGIKSDKGLVDYLVHDEPVSSLIIWPGIDKLTLISGGEPIWESAELLGSPKMQQLVQEMRGRYPDRYVFFDVPPVLSGADALAFSPFVDAIVFVIKAGHTSKMDIKRALDILPKEKIIGLVLNQRPVERARSRAYGS
jgi:non-specific protein-tyrosine kinase